jgi:alpha-glucoside transport system substrate-binding protein
MKRRASRVFAALIVSALAFTACQPGVTPGTADKGSVSVLAVWGGAEQESFLAMVKPFEERTGIKVEYTGTREANAILTTRVQANNPPDIAGLPGPGQMAEFAKAGKLIDLGPVLDQSKMRDEYSEDWIKLGQVDGKQYGIFIKSSIKGLIWHDPKQFREKNFTTPKTWEELLSLSRRMQAAGTAPWCLGLESGAASGWPGTDWIEDIVLRQAGPDNYDKWYQGTLKWTSPEIRRAWQTWGEIVATPGMVFGGKQAILATNFGTSGNPMFDSPPKCFMHHQASFITDFFVQAKPGLKPGTDFTFFGFPDIDTRYAGAAEVAGDLFGMFNDTTQARELMKYLASAEAQQIWVKRGGALSANKKVAAADYPDDIARQSAKLITDAKGARFDASDLMPEAMNNAFWKAVLDYVNDPSKLDTILAGLDRVQTDSYRR